ncbi:MAG: benzoyl-CoA 2,3-epoxidase subunit BoxB [Alphaproteobacteria bacterium]
MSSVNYAEKIPNNVQLGDDRQLQRALEHWQPKYLQWWGEMGPEGFQTQDVYLRTAISVDPQGWAQYGYVRMPEYRWGIFLTPPEADRRVNFGDHLGKPAWNEVPGEYRATLRRLIVTQGDTEPASVEQQHHLGRTCPSLYDLRNLFQVNVEEGRHLWAMVYLLQKYFGRDGREEAEAMLERRSGDEDKPRILAAFNEKTPDWLSFFFFTFLTDRDGKYQLASLAESGFDPLSRTCKFMLTEEAHHLFVGETGIGRILQRTAEVMNQLKTDDPAKIRQAGCIDLPTLQRYLNFHFSVTLDLYGSEVSTNAANYYTMGLKGRFEETKIADDHKLGQSTYAVPDFDGIKIITRAVPALNAMNERLRDDYIVDCQKGVDRWNKILERAGIDFRLKLAHKTFHRKIGTFAGVHVDPTGTPISEAEWTHKSTDWLPSHDDHAFVQSLMKPVTVPGKFANWIAPPARGINNQPVDFEYVRLA